MHGDDVPLSNGHPSIATIDGNSILVVYYYITTLIINNTAILETLAFRPSSKTGFALLPSRKVVSLVCHYETGVTR